MRAKDENVSVRLMASDVAMLGMHAGLIGVPPATLNRNILAGIISAPFTRHTLPEEPLSSMASIPVSGDTAKALRASAKKNGMDLSDYVRGVLRGQINPRC